jgi:hypothetical protein
MGKLTSSNAWPAEALSALVDLSSDLAEAGETVGMLLVLVPVLLAGQMYNVPSSVVVSSLRVMPDKGSGSL